MRVRPQRSFFVLMLALSLASGVAPSLGQVPDGKRDVAAPPAVFVFGDVECPDPKTVQQAVLSLIPPERHSLLARGVRVELEDLGDSYRITVWKDGASVKKSYSDPARECEGRARFAAVFAVLTLMPPELGVEPVVKPKPEPEPKREPTKPPPAIEPLPEEPTAKRSSPTLPPLVHLELSALYVAAPAILEAPSLHSFGGELRVAIGRGALSGTFSAAYTSRAKFELDGVHAELSRIPLSLGARFRNDFDAWTLSADLGLLVAAERVRATNLLTTTPRSSIDVGVRAGAQLAHRFGPHFAPFLGAFAWFSPSPSELSALPRGTIGNLPYLWLGGVAGVSFGL